MAAPKSWLILSRLTSKVWPAGPASRLAWPAVANTVSPERVSAPLESEPDARHAWNESRLEHASRPVLAELAQLADDSDMVIALGDNAGQLLWTYGSERMQKLARSINFVPAQVRANSGVFRLATDGSGRLSVFNGSGGSTHILIDVNGYLE